MPLQGLLHIHRLDIDKLLDAIVRQLTSIAAGFYTAERQARVGLHQGVDKATARFQSLGHKTFTPGQIPREHGGPRPKGESFATRMASASPCTATIAATGPNVSSS